MPWTFAPVFDAGHRAALDSGKNLIYVAPPAAWATRPLFAQLSGTTESKGEILVLIPEIDMGADLVAELHGLDELRPVHLASGLARTTRLIGAGRVRTLLATPEDGLELLRRSSLAVEGARRVVILWPEIMATPELTEALDVILADAATAQRIIVTGDERDAGSFIDRHARRAPLLAAARIPERPVGALRCAVVSSARLAWAAQATLDMLNPPTALLWDPSARAAHRWWAFRDDSSVRVGTDPGTARVAVAVAAECPSPAALEALGAAAEEVVVLARPWQLPYLQRLGSTLSVLRLPSEADRSHGWRSRLRAAVRGRLETRQYADTLVALGPVLDEFDPALVAAALADASPAPRPGTTAPGSVPAWVHLRVNLGRRDRVRTADIVGALLNAVGLARDQVGRVEVREAASVIEVRAEVAERARQGLDGMTVRGRQLTARFDRK